MATASSIRAGSAFVEILVDRSGLLSGLKAAEKKFLGFGNGLSRIGAVTLGSGAAIAAAFAPAVSAAATFEDRLSRFEQIFGNQSASVRSFAQTFGKEVGRSESELLDFLGTSQSLLIPLGFDPKDAAEISKTIARLSIDIGSFANLEDADVFRKIIAGLTGESDGLKALGIIANETAIASRAMTLGFDPKNLSAAAKAQTVLQLVLGKRPTEP